MKNKVHSNQILPFAISLSIFMIAAVFGWFKLHYGFNFTDEGWQMTEAWRLTVGDDFFKDGLMGTGLRAATSINALIFRIYPGITLLGFREIQFLVTIVALLLLSFALYKINKDFWFQPLIFSIFAFTGLEPIGLMSNLSYFTYPHLFITLHLVFLIMGMLQQSVLLKRIFFITAGIFLWLISFSLLHMSHVIFSVILLYCIVRKSRVESFDFSGKDLCIVLAPFIMLWTLFLVFYGNHFIKNIISDTQCFLLTSTHHIGSLISINWDAMKRIIITLPFVIAFLWSTKISKPIYLTGVLLIIASMMFIFIETSCFGWMKPFYGGWYNGWINRPLWFGSLLVSAYLLLLCHFIFKIIKNKSWNNLEIFALVLFIPSAISAVSGSIFSAMGIIAILHFSIPAVAAITLVILSMEAVRKRKYFLQFLILLLFFAPFYYSTAWSDWKFTFFDVAPEQANAEIETGFGRGIKTNQVYKDLYDWISTTSQIYSKKDDLIISYVSSPMVHMIAQRRPALNLSFIPFNELPDSYFQMLIESMKSHGRNPQIAYVFEAMPALVPIDLENPARLWLDKEFSFPAGDPISAYVLANMTMIDSFLISRELSLSVRCFIDNASAINILSKKLKNNPIDPAVNFQMGNLYQKRKDLDKAQDYYQRALNIDSNFIPALMNMATIQSLKGNDMNAVTLLKKIIAVDPQLIDAYYKIACIYAKQKRIEDSISWLKKAVDKGFNRWEQLRTDPDLDNIRGVEYYKNMMNNHVQ